MKTKTFYQIAKEVDPETLYPSIVPDALRATIYDWYVNRHVSDDDNFILFFRRILMEYYPKYYAILRLESGISTYDWLVESYEEEKRTHGETIGRDKTASETTGKASEKVETPQKSMSEVSTTSILHGQTTTRTDDTTSASTYNGLSTNAQGSGGIGSSVAKQAPMSIAMSGYDGGANSVDAENTSLSQSQAISGELDYASTLSTSAQNSQTKSKGTSSGSDSTHNTGTVTTANSGTDTQTVNKTVTDGGSVTTSDNSTGTKTGTEGMTENVSSEDLGVKTGRYTRISALLRDATDFIAATDAWHYLSGKLDACFMGIYDV